MRRSITVLSIACLAIGYWSDLEGNASRLEPLAFLQKHCIECHGEEKQKGDRRFDQLTLDFHDLDTAWDWEEILDLMNLGEMPPPDEPQPSSDEKFAMIDWITWQLDTVHAVRA